MATAKLTRGTVSASLLALSMPMMLGIFANMGAALFETWLLGRVSTSALAAYSFTFAVTQALSMISLGISIGLSSVLARTVGGGDQKMIRRLATDGIGLLAVVMLIASVIGFMTIEPLFRLLGADAETLPLIKGYMQIWYVALVLYSLPSIGASALRATGDARLSGSIMVGGALLQAIIDPILIFGLFGLPALGLEGAAWSLLLSRVVLCAFTYYVLIYREQLLDFSATTYQQVLHSWRQVMIVGLPATATQMIGPVSTAIIVSFLAEYGKEAVAGFGIASRVEALSIIPLFALSASIGPFVGQNWGAGRQDRANQGMKLTFIWSLCWGLGAALMFMFFGDGVAALFEDNLQVINYASLYLAIVPISYGAWGVLMMASATFNSLGKPIASTTLSVVRMFVIYVPLAYFGREYFGVAGIFGACCISNIAMGLLSFTWNRSTYGGKQPPMANAGL